MFSVKLLVALIEFFFAERLQAHAELRDEVSCSFLPSFLLTALLLLSLLLQLGDLLEVLRLLFETLRLCPELARGLVGRAGWSSHDLAQSK